MRLLWFPRHDFGFHPMKERLQALGHQVSNTVRAFFLISSFAKHFRFLSSLQRHPYDFEVDIGSAEVANILSKVPFSAISDLFLTRMVKIRPLSSFVPLTLSIEGSSRRVFRLSYVQFGDDGVYDMDKIGHILKRIYFDSVVWFDTPNGFLNVSFNLEITLK